MTGRMRTSLAGLELIKSFEGFRETAARLPDGRWTIGYGHVRTAREGLTISEKDATDLLTYDLKPVEDAIGSWTYAPLMQNQFDALVSLAFNISPGQFRESEILANINAGNYLAAANGFDLWRKARLNGRVMVVDALVRRRAAEKSLFLDHPSGHPAAPTPIVVPQIDVAQYQRLDDDEDRPSPSGDIAEAVRRLAERTRESINPTLEIPLPLGATVAAPEQKQPEQKQPVVERQAPAEPDQPAATQKSDDASRVMAERVARILERVEAPEAGAHPAPRHEPKTRHQEVREGLPDFDQPAEHTIHRARPIIDDTEIIAPPVDPATLFAEAERKAKYVNGASKRVGPISGRLAMQAPWIILLVLSVLGLVIGSVDAFQQSTSLDDSLPRAAATILAVFGVMLLMSVYFLFWNRPEES